MSDYVFCHFQYFFFADFVRSSNAHFLLAAHGLPVLFIFQLLCRAQRLNEATSHYERLKPTRKVVPNQFS